MEHVNMETSLHSMINSDLDPLNAELHLSADLPDSVLSSHTSQTEHEHHAELNNQDVPPNQSKNRNGAERKRKVIFPGSAADFRRKEANRLAADRSRSRAQEKRVALINAKKSLADENKKLLAEINRLQQVNPDTSLAHLASGQETPDESHPVPAIGVGMGQTSSEAQDSHSRTILAALMSAGQDGFGDDSDDAWIQGVEDMFNEAEKSGRLGELAALATGRNGTEKEIGEGGVDVSLNDQEAVNQTDETLPHEVLEQASEPPQVETIEPVEPAHTIEALISRKFDYRPDDSAAKLTSAVAVLLNAEIERTLRDDLAATKAAIAHVDKELSRLKELEAQGELHTEKTGDLEYRGQERRAILPDVLLASSQEAIRYETATFVGGAKLLDKRIPTLRQSLSQIKTDKIGEETRLASTVGEAQEMVSGCSLAVKMRTARMLKGVTGIVGELLHGPQREYRPMDPTSAASFLSPAIARRRRGRPPKGPEMPNTTDSTDHPSSKLMDSITAEAVAAATAAVAEAEGQEALSRHDDTSDTQPDSSHMIAPTPEQYILSHLQDSSSFSGFYPHVTEDVDPALRSAETPPVEERQEETMTETQGEDANDEAARQQADRLSVLSRWKKGGPDSCDICSRTQTSVWRKLTFNGEDLKVCNACGLYYHKFKVIRPSELWGDGKSLKKRRAAQRRVEGGGEDMEGKGKKRKRGRMEQPENQGVEVGADDMEISGDGGVTEEIEEVEQVEQVGDIQNTVEADSHKHEDQALDSFEDIHDANMASVLGMER